MKVLTVFLQIFYKMSHNNYEVEKKLIDLLLNFTFLYIAISERNPSSVIAIIF